jgi:hypothetical protein
VADFTLKKGDRLPVLSAQLRDEKGSGYNLAGYTVAFRARAAGATGAATISGSCTVADSANGKVTYTWGASDTTTAGTYEGEFVLTHTASGKVQTVPSSGYVTLVIEDVLA